MLRLFLMLTKASGHERLTRVCRCRGADASTVAATASEFAGAGGADLFFFLLDRKLMSFDGYSIRSKTCILYGTVAVTVLPRVD